MPTKLTEAAVGGGIQMLHIGYANVTCSCNMTETVGESRGFGDSAGFGFLPFAGSIGRGQLVVAFAELPGKVFRIVEAHLVGNFRHRELALL